MMIMLIIITKQLLLVCFVVRWREKQENAAISNVHPNLSQCLEGQKDEKGWLQPGEWNKIQDKQGTLWLSAIFGSLFKDQFSGEAVPYKFMIFSCSRPPGGAWLHCLPACLLAYSNELILLTQLCLSSLRHNSLQWFSGCHRAAFRYIKHNVLNSNMGEQCELLAGLFVFQSHSVLDSYNIQQETGLNFYNHRII